jgi:uncharacterized RDD family membrane protein YckC
MECPRCRRKIGSQTRRCNWCGIDVPPGQRWLEESGVAPPAQPAPGDGDKSPAPRLATLGDRFIALVLDTAILLSVFVLIDVWAFMKWGVVSGRDFRLTAAVMLVGGSLNAVFAFAYLWILEATFGSTVGKAIVGIGVVNNSERHSLAASAIRNLLRVVDGLGFYLVGTLVAVCSKFRRRIGDVCAGTYVVEGNLSQVTRALAVLVWVAVLAGGAWALPYVCARPKPSKIPRFLGRTVIQLGRSDKSVYVKLPHYRIDVRLAKGAAAEVVPSTQEEDAGNASIKGSNSPHSLD